MDLIKQALRTSVATAAFLSLGAIAAPVPAYAVSPATPTAASSESAMDTRAVQANQRFQIAQASNCRQVSSAVGGLTVRQEPSIGAEPIGVIANGRNVTIQSLGANGWVPITAPLEGFVSAEYLTSCNLAIAPPDASPPDEDIADRGMCRTVSAANGLNVRAEPSIDANRVTELRDGRSVIIENRGANGWVPITEPVDGYVAAEYLSYCP